MIAANDDPSIENLSSIVFLADYGGKTILMTGDARGDYIIDGLKRANRFGADGIDLDVLKVQHHGSSHNNDGQFFHDVRARHYVISANGMYDNPDRATLDNIIGGRGYQSGYIIWLTNRGQPGSDLRQMLDTFMSKKECAGCERENATSGSVRGPRQGGVGTAFHRPIGQDL